MGNNSSSSPSKPTNSASLTSTDEVSPPTPPELSKLSTVQASQPISDIGSLGAELAREFQDSDGPKFWDKMSGNDCLVDVDKKSKEYEQALRHFRKTSSKVVVKIERVQNKFLWRRYQSQKILMMTKNKGIINERVLFHGTRNTPPDKIYKGQSASGFDPRLGTGYYGKGAYFAADSNYSIACYAYPKPGTSPLEKQIFLATVLCGVSKNYGTAKATHLKRAEVQPDGNLFDSSYGGPHLVGSVKSMMYVVYETSQSYPLYLYTYRQ